MSRKSDPEPEDAAGKLRQRRARDARRVQRYIEAHAVLLHTIGLDRATARQLEAIRKHYRLKSRAAAVRTAIHLAAEAITRPAP